MAVMMRISGGLVGLQIENVLPASRGEHILKGHDDARKNNDGVSRGTFGHFGVIRGSLLDTLG